MSKIRAEKTSEVLFVVSCNGVSTVPGSGIAGASFTTDGWSSGPSVSVQLCSGLEPSAENEVEVFKATEAQWNAYVAAPNYVTFSGFTGSSGMRLLEPPALPTRKLEFLGDSITAGYCNLCHDELHPKGFGVGSESFALSWPTLVGRLLGAQVHAAAWSGWGMVQNSWGGNDTLMSDVWKRTLASVPADGPDLHGTTPENLWNFSDWKPDGVVINLGTNDFHNLPPERVRAYQETYLELVLDAHAAYGPGTRFFLACGPMTDLYCDSVFWVLDEAERRGVKATFLDQRGFMDGEHGQLCCGHPGQDVDAAMADGAATNIAQAMGWQHEVVA